MSTDKAITKGERRVYAFFPGRVESSLIFNSSHSGRDYPDDFNHVCSFNELLRAEDNFVDELLAGVTDKGAALCCALFPRTYIDANRPVTDIDTDMLSEPWPGPISHSPRCNAGNGLIRRTLTGNTPIYDRKLSAAEVRHRIDNYYLPYHATLAEAADNAHLRHGHCWLLDCHSMPASASPAHFVLGDRDGTACSRAFLKAIKDYLTEQGYKVAVNDPYRGAEIVRRHGIPAQGRHAIQVEISKALYWDEQKQRRLPDFTKTANIMGELAAFLSIWVARPADQDAPLLSRVE